MSDNSLKIFFSALFITAFLPYLPAILPFLPAQIFGFKLTGWAWISMLLVTLSYLPSMSQLSFPVWCWLPWMIYISIFIIWDMSMMGLQLTLQYLLPILAGWVASSFTYTKTNIKWIFKQFTRLIVIVTTISIFYKFVFGYSPAMASTPMLLSIAAALVMSFYFITKETKYIVYFLILFLMPFLNVTRMGIAAFLAIWVLHFANNNMKGKIIYGFLGFLMVIFVFNSSAFQKKTFYEGKGEITDLNLNYYENQSINSSGRSSWKNALEEGMEKSPLWGNGPRSDASKLGQVIGKDYGEAHNDYMSVRYNYGYVGLSFLLFGFASSFWILFRQFKQCTDPWEFALYSSILTLFVVFLMFMFSDNILKYTITFPNIFFAMMGIATSIYKAGGILEDELYEES